MMGRFLKRDVTMAILDWRLAQHYKPLLRGKTLRLLDNFLKENCFVQSVNILLQAQ